MSLLKDDLKLEIKINEIDKTYEEAIKNKRKYKYYENSYLNILSFDSDGQSIISIARTFIWADSESDECWPKKIFKIHMMVEKYLA